MYENDDKKRSFDCDNNINQTSRSKRRRIEGPLINSLDTKLGSNCLQHILSFLTYEKVSQMRQVCKTFNEIGKRLLAKGHIELEKRLKKEIERAENRVLLPTNVRSSYDTIRFLKTLDRAVYDCTISYKYHIDYFVAGKLLDEAISLLEDFDSVKMIPYFLEHACDQKVHPSLGPFTAHSRMAWIHFRNDILHKISAYDSEAALDGAEQNIFETRLIKEQNEVIIIKTNLLKNMMQRINCGKAMNRELYKLIVNLNESVLVLILRAKKVDEELGKVVNAKHLLDNEGLSNYLFQLCLPSNWPFKKAAKMVGIRVGSKRLNLATLPSSCIKKILSYFSCDKMAHLRAICKSFNDASKKEINREFETVKQKLEFQIKINEKRDMRWANKSYALKTNIMKDIRSLLQLCKDNYKRHFGANYYFVAGKVVDEAKHVIYTNRGLPWYDIFHDADSSYKFQPHYYLFHLMDVVYKAIAHFKFNIVPKYLAYTQSYTYVPDFMVSGVVMNFEKTSQAIVELEEIVELIEEADAKIKEQNDKNRKFLKIISDLKRKIVILKKKKLTY